MLTIPHYPNVCRICLEDVTEKESIPLKETKSGDTYKNLLYKIASNYGTNSIEDFLPQSMCSLCRERLDEFATFQTQVNASECFLNAYVQLQHHDVIEPLKELLNSTKFVIDFLRETLNRIGMVGEDDLLVEVLLNDEEKPDLMDLEFKPTGEQVDYPLLDEHSDVENQYSDSEKGLEHEDPDEMNGGCNLDTGGTDVLEPQSTNLKSGPENAGLRLKYKCRHCTKRYLLKGNLKEHWKAKHGKYITSKGIEKSAFGGSDNNIDLQSSQLEHMNATSDQRQSSSSENDVLYLDTESQDPTVQNPIILVEGVKMRQCVFEICGLVPLTEQSKHAKECHRAYCKICGLVFPASAHVFKHLLIHTPRDQRLSCELCGKLCWDETRMRVHWREMHGRRLCNAECPHCEQLFETYDQMSAHRSEHKQCKFCPLEFDVHQDLTQHMLICHRDSFFKCAECNLRFLGRKEHKKHMDRHRTGAVENNIKFPVKGWSEVLCVGCDRAYYNEQYLVQHISNDHKNGLETKPQIVKEYRKRSQQDKDSVERNLQCPDCDKRFRTKTCLRHHRSVLHNGQRHICAVCGACLKTHTALKMHESYKHTKNFRFECEFCDKRCQTRGDLAKHRRTHTNEKPYKCTNEGCDKAYKTRSALVHHNYSHTGERPYKCVFAGCTKSYNNSHPLKVHMREHTLEKPYKCWYCDLLFKSTGNRRKHCKRHHAGKPFGRQLEKQLQDQKVQSKEEIDNLDGVVK